MDTGMNSKADFGPTIEGIHLPKEIILPPEVITLLPYLGFAELKVTLAAIARFMRVGGAEPITLTEFEELTGLSHQAVLDGIAAAMKRGIIDRYEVTGYRGHTSHVYEIRVALESENSIGLTSRPINPVVKLVKTESDSTLKDKKDLTDSTQLTDSTKANELRKALRKCGVYPGSVAYLISHYPQEHIQAYLDLFPEALRLGMAEGSGWLVNAIKGAWSLEQIREEIAARKEMAEEQPTARVPDDEPDCTPSTRHVPEEVLRLWQACSSYLAGEISRANYETWVRSCQPYAYDDQNGIYRIGVANSFARDWLNSRVSKILSNFLVGLLGKQVQVVFDLNWDCTQ
jgi:hypothetical protein